MKHLNISLLKEIEIKRQKNEASISKLKPIKKGLSEELEIFVQFLLSNRDTVGSWGESGENAVWTTKYIDTSIIKYMLYIHRPGGPYWEKLFPSTARGPSASGRTRDRGHSFSQYGPTKAGE